MQLKPVSSNLIQNFGYRPRTTVNSRGIEKNILPINLTGTVTNIALNNYYSGPRLHENEDIVPIINAMTQLGVDKDYSSYLNYIKKCDNPHKELLDMIKIPPKELMGYDLPSVGIVVNNSKVYCRGFECIPTLLTAVYMMARCGDNVFLRDKNPLLGRLSFDREIAVLFLGEK
ncbi:MAG: hypothetical protein H8D23_16925 [Candidatus Brocadiales bacterium]|nr:hypothetical protein [Candidatus Brocadiales bacterium]